MKEYIEKDKPFSLLKNYLNKPNGQYNAQEVVDLVDDLISDIPAADVVEVRHAYWRDIQPPDQDNNVQCWCSACGAGELHADGMIVPYCWKCGAKMGGGVNDVDFD